MRLLAALMISASFIFSACGGRQTARHTEQSDSVPAIDPAKVIHPGVPVNPYATVDISPMDMIYYPPNYPQLKMTGEIKTPPAMRIIYSRPHLQGRHFSQVVKPNEPWRLGANEATELDVYQPVRLGGEKIKPGRYTLYCIPGPASWQIVINSNTDQWGLKQDSTKDLFKVEAPVVKGNLRLEYFTMVFMKERDGDFLLMGWDDQLVRLPVKM